MEIDYPYQRQPLSKELRTIPEGTVFEGIVGDYTGLFLKAYGVVVYLVDPHRTWTVGSVAPFHHTVEAYQPVDAKVVVMGPAKT